MAMHFCAAPYLVARRTKSLETARKTKMLWIDCKIYYKKHKVE